MRFSKRLILPLLPFIPGPNKPLAYRKVKDGIAVTVPKLSLREVPGEHAFAFKVTYIVE